MFSFILIVLLNLLSVRNYRHTKSVFSSEVLNTPIHQPNELLQCLKYVTTSLAERSRIVLFKEEIEEISWINTFLKNIDNPVSIVSVDEDISNVFGFYILFPEYKSKEVQQFWNNQGESRFLAVWTKDVLANSLQTIFERFWSQRYTNILGIAKNETDHDFKLYSFSAYSEGKCGSVKIVEVDKWNRTSSSFARVLNFYKNNTVNLHKCVLRVLGNHRPPDSIMHINWNTLDLELSGVSKRLLDIAEEYFNFSSIIYPAIYRTNINHSWYFYAEELDFICDTVRQEIVDFASGWFSYSAIEMDNLNSRGLELGTVTSIDCFGWVVPLRAGTKPPNSCYFTEEFGHRAWSLIFIIICTTSVVMCCILGKTLPNAILLTIQTSLEQPVNGQSTFRKASFRVLFSNFCFYSLVVSAAYKASFASFITVSFHGKDFTTVQEIVESPLKWYGSPNMLRILNATTSGTRSLTKKILNNFNVLPPSNFEDVMTRLIRQRDIAVFGVKRNMYYHSIDEAKRLKMRTPFRFIPGCLIRPHTTHFLFKRGSFLIRPFNRLLNRLFETGIASYWILHLGSNKILPAERLKEKNIRLQFLKTPLRILFIGYMISYFVFILELIYNRVCDLKRPRSA